MGALNPDVSTIDRTRSHVWARQLQNTRTKRGVQPTAPTKDPASGYQAKLGALKCT